MKKRWQWLRKSCLVLLAGIFFLPAMLPSRQGVSAPARAAAISAQGGVYLVFPFESAGASPRLDWIGEGLEELTIQKLSAAGQQVYSHAGRTAEMDRSGLPPTAKISRASMLRIAQNMDADYVVF